MARKKKVRIDRIIILILTLILVIGAILFGIYKLYNTFFNKDEAIEYTSNVDVTTTNEIKISCNNYNIYYDETNELEFNFIIAELKFESDNPILFDLNNLQTSEKISLDDVNMYYKKLESASYDINKIEANNSIIQSNDNVVLSKVLIPFNTDANNLSLYNAIDSSRIDFDLTKERIPVTIFKLSNMDTQIEVGTTKVSITNAYISSFMLRSDVPYDISSSSKIYSFEITVLEAQDNVYITDAIFIENGSSDEIQCKPKEYRSIDMDNIIGVNLTKGTKGGLFFEVYSNDETVHDGKLLIQFSNSDKYFELFKGE